jgi:small-conductance mechanosensitive channel
MDWYWFLDMVEGVSLNFFQDPLAWLIDNAFNIGAAIIFAIIVLFIVRVVVSQIEGLRRRGRLDRNASYLIQRIIRWGSYVLIASFIITQLGFRISSILGFAAVAGGTVLGFAAINTLGNAIAGIIVMTSRPFGIGDRVLFDNEFVDILSINLIYTKMMTTDNVTISVPNQLLLQREIFNYGRLSAIRRKCIITADYREPVERVEKALHEAISMIGDVMEEPKAYIWITNIGSYAIEYTLYYYVENLKALNRIDAAVKRQVILTCAEYGIDLSTPSLIKSVSDSNGNNDKPLF